MRSDINDQKTLDPFVGLVSYCKILVTLDMQSAHYQVALHNYRNITYRIPFFNHITQCVPSPEDEHKFKIPHSFNFAFLGKVSRKNTPLNSYRQHADMQQRLDGPKRWRRVRAVGAGTVRCSSVVQRLQTDARYRDENDND